MATIDGMTAEIRGARVTVTGTVDGETVTVHLWRADFAGASTKAERAAIAAAALVAAARRQQPDSTLDISGTYTV